MSGLLRAAARGLGLRGAALRLAPTRTRLPGERGVALTFDDGPDPVFTPQVLDALAADGARVTFFLVGRRVEQHPELVRRIVAEGHAIGSHSYSHRDAWTLSLRELAREFRAGRRAVEEAAGRQVRLFRPPKGWWDASSALAVRAAGLEAWLWTVSADDWQPGVTAEEIGARTRDLAGGDVVVLHDGLELPVAPEAADRSATVAALPALLARIRERGLECVTLPDGAAR